MKIVNLANSISLSEDVMPAYSFAKRLKGLLGRQSLRRGQSMLLRPANSIHTFFMRFHIDVLFVDKNNMVIKAINDLSPFRATGIYLKSAFVIELPAGTIQETMTKEGDYLQIQ